MHVLNTALKSVFELITQKSYISLLNVIVKINGKLCFFFLIVLSYNANHNLFIRDKGNELHIRVE